MPPKPQVDTARAAHRDRRAMAAAIATPGWRAAAAWGRAARRPSTRIESPRILRASCLIAAEFSGPAEGRGYTQARQLRERFEFAGELRAIGYVRRDQLFFMARCGFNSFELPDADIEDALHGVRDLLPPPISLRTTWARSRSQLRCAIRRTTKGVAQRDHQILQRSGRPLPGFPAFRLRAPACAADAAPTVR